MINSYIYKRADSHRYNENEQVIFFRDAHKQKQKLSLIHLNTKAMLSGDHRLGGFGLDQEAMTMEHLQSCLSCGVNSSVAYRNLLFIKVTNTLWTVHHKNSDGETKHFETIDFTTYLENDLFNHLINEMVKGPEHYWGLDSFREIPKNYADRVIEDFLNGYIQAKPFGNSSEEQFQESLKAKRYEVETGWFYAYKLRESRWEMNLYETMLRWQLVDDIFCDTAVTDIVRLQSTLGFCTGIGQSVSYRNLVFLLSSEKVWCVYHKNQKDEMVHFETIDFTPYVEHGLFAELIEGMVKGPEYYWSVAAYTAMPENKSQQILRDFLNGTIQPSEAMMEYHWVEMMTKKNREQNEPVLNVWAHKASEHNLAENKAIPSEDLSDDKIKRILDEIPDDEMPF